MLNRKSPAEPSSPFPKKACLDAPILLLLYCYMSENTMVIPQDSSKR